MAGEVKRVRLVDANGTEIEVKETSVDKFVASGFSRKKEKESAKKAASAPESQNKPKDKE